MFESCFCFTLIRNCQLQLPQALQQATVLGQHVPLCIFTLAFPFHLIQASAYLEETWESPRSYFAERKYIYIYFFFLHRKTGCIIPQSFYCITLSFTELTTQKQFVLLALRYSFFMLWGSFRNEIRKHLLPFHLLTSLPSESKQNNIGHWFIVHLLILYTCFLLNMEAHAQFFLCTKRSYRNL